RLLNDAIAIRKKQLGLEHPRVATTIDSLGGLYEAQGRINEAERAYKEALDIQEKRLKPEFPEHPDLATSQANLGALYKSQGRYAEAGPLLRSALRIREKSLG